jgi:hypothetical protein
MFVLVPLRKRQDKLPEAWLFVNPNSGNSYPTKRIDEL